MTPFDFITDKFNDTYTNFINTVSTQLIEFLLPLFNSALIIWFAVWGYKLIMGQSNGVIQEAFYKMIRIAFIMYLGLTVGSYSSITVKFLNGWHNDIANVIIKATTGGSGGDLNSILSMFSTRVAEIGGALWEQAALSTNGFGFFILSIAIYLVGYLLCTVLLGFYLISNFWLALLLGLGPLFISLCLFKTTQRFFEMWLSTVITQGMILVLAVSVGMSVLSIIIDLMDSVQDGFSPSFWTLLSNYYGLFIFFGLSLLMFKQVYSIASGLGGGASIIGNDIIRSGLASMSGGMSKGFGQMKKYENKYRKNSVSKK